jgi:uncharacterized DUF497 family protein
VKIYEWDSEKNIKLKEERGLSFEEVVFYLERNDVLDVMPHPNRAKYPNQRIFVLNIDGYVYLVPFVERDNTVFLKTIIPSRKATKKYIERQ